MREALIIYCQHTMGIGHLVRTFALAEAFAERFEVTVLNGGILPDELPLPTKVRRVDLPPLLMTSEGRLTSPESGLGVDEVFERRRAILKELVGRVRPRVVLIELFPFGRKKFTSELIPLIEACREQGALVVSSVRDILVRSRKDQDAYDERACVRANRWFDAILVHGDPRITRFEESFRPKTRLACPLAYTGFVGPSRNEAPTLPERAPRVVVSAGGGRFGSPLRTAAIGAHPLLRERAGLDMVIVAGPLLPDLEWRALEEQCRQHEGLEVCRAVPDLRSLLRSASVSVSQCGYNTFVDLVSTRTPAVVVPFAEAGEDEQRRRASRLAGLDLLTQLDPDRLTATRLADAVLDRIGRPPKEIVDLGGADVSVRVVEDRLASGDRAPWGAQR